MFIIKDQKIIHNICCQFNTNDIKREENKIDVKRNLLIRATADVTLILKENMQTDVYDIDIGLRAMTDLIGVISKLTDEINKIQETKILIAYTDDD